LRSILALVSSGENQTEDSGPNGRNLRPTVDPVGSIRLILSTSVIFRLNLGILDADQTLGDRKISAREGPTAKYYQLARLGRFHKAPRVESILFVK
jgi:hypothetical protein